MKEYYFPIIVIAAWVIFRLTMRQQIQDSFYRCPHCHFEFHPSGWLNFLGPHLLVTKYVKCPRCRRRGWASIIRG